MKRNHVPFLIGSIAVFFSMAFLPSSRGEETQVFRTALKIAVINELGNIEEGTEVTLYKSKEDYRNEENPAVPTQVTDKRGKVTFKDLKPIIYYIHAVKGDKNNDAAGVQTDKLVEGKLNKINIVIE